MRTVQWIGRALLVSSAALTAITGSACAPSAEATQDKVEAIATAAPQEITIIAKNYLFVAPDTISSGMTTFRLQNNGTEHHHVQLVRFREGKTLDDLMAALEKNPHALPQFVTAVGGPNSPEPAGGESLGTVDLEPGNYALLCLIPTAEGVPHLVKGMSRPLTVVPSNRAPIPAPNVDATLVLDDYKFELGSQLTAGKRTLQVENRAAQPHEVFIARLNPGATAEQVLQVIMTGKGPMPAVALGGSTFIQRGGINYITLDLVPGKYALFCFVPDHKDGKPHVAHGMMQEITVN